MKTLLHTLLFFLLVTQFCFAQWVQIGLNDKSIKDIAARNSTIFAVTSDSGSVYRSNDNGINWSRIVELGVIDIDVSPTGDVFMLKDSIYNTGPKQLFRSTDVGSTWNYLNVLEQIPQPLRPYRLNNVRFNPSGTIFCGLCNIYYGKSPPSSSIAISKANYVPYSSIAISTDNGISWMEPNDRGEGVGLMYDFRGNSIISEGYCLFPTSGYQYSISLSDDGGLQWTYLGSAPLWWIELKTLKLCLNGNILAGGMGMFLSNDSCNSWIQISTIIPTCGLSIESGGMLVGTDSLGLFMFSDNGDSLGSHNEGLTNLNVHTLTIDNNNYVYDGTDNGVWRRPLSEIVTFVEEEKIDEVPTKFSLSQNYPNPFNPSTKIKYSIPKSSQVVVKVFDVLGNEIETLVNEEKPVGTYEVNWNAANLPSGVYFYRLQAGDFVQTRKMILLK